MKPLKTNELIVDFSKYEGSKENLSTFSVYLPIY